VTQIKVDRDIVVRPLRPEEAGLVYALIDANRAYIARFLPWCTPEYSVEDARKFIVQQQETYSKGDSAGGGIFFKRELVGDIGMRGFKSPNKSASIGYWLAEPWQGRGIVTRCCRKLIDLAFSDYGLHRVEILAAASNVRSQAVPKRLGFVHEATLREAVRIADGYQDFEVYSVLAHEWPNVAEKRAR
jgi:ribosomal-protein-serine acetyltransferase